VTTARTARRGQIRARQSRIATFTFGLRLRRGVRLLALLDANLCTSTDYDTTQKWAIALTKHPKRADSLRYYSRPNPAKINYAIFGSAESKLRWSKSFNDKGDRGGYYKSVSARADQPVAFQP